MTKKEILELLKPFDNNAEINIQYTGELQFSLKAILNDTVTHLGETIKKNISPNNNCGFKIFAKDLKNERK